MRKRSLFILIFGLLLFIWPFFVNKLILIRLISLCIGALLICLSIFIGSKHNNIIKIVIVPLILILATYSLDYIVVKLFNTIPIICYEKVSSAKVKTYNAIGYRIYSCNNKLIYDGNYDKAYPCSNDDIKTININKFLASSDSFKKYNNKFVHLEGKINTIIGNSSLYINAYKESEETLNGFVTFDENKKVVVDNLSIDPTEYYIYDNVEVIGLVSYIINNDDTYEIHLTNAKIIKSNIYDEYELIVNNITSYDKVEKEDNIFFVGIDCIYYKYSDDSIYELNYLLTDKRITLESIIKEDEYTLLEDKSKLYKTGDYNIIECSDDSIIFVNKSYKKIDNLCSNNE